jgi:hypothetical protein
MAWEWMSIDRSAATGRTDQDVDPGESEEKVTPRRRNLGMCDWRSSVLVRETLAGDFELRGDVSSGDEAVVADLDEAGGKDVEQKSAHELNAVDGDGVAVLGAEAHLVSVEADQALI